MVDIKLNVQGLTGNTLSTYRCPRCSVELQVWGKEKKTLAENLSRGNRANIDYSVYIPKIECPICGFLVESQFPELVDETRLDWETWNNSPASGGVNPQNDQSITDLVYVPDVRERTDPVGGDNESSIAIPANKFFWFACPRCAANFYMTGNYLLNTIRVSGNYLDREDENNNLGFSYYYVPCITCNFYIVMTTAQMTDLGLEFDVAYPFPWVTVQGRVTDFEGNGVAGAKVSVVEVTDITGNTPVGSSTDPHPVPVSIDPSSGEGEFIFIKQADDINGTFYRLSIESNPDSPARTFAPSQGHVVRLPILDDNQNPLFTFASSSDEYQNFKSAPNTTTDITPQIKSGANVWEIAPPSGGNEYGVSFKSSNPQYLVQGHIDTINSSGADTGDLVGYTLNIYAWSLVTNQWVLLSGRAIADWDPGVNIGGGGFLPTNIPDVPYNTQTDPVTLSWADPVTDANGDFAFYTTDDPEFTNDYKIVAQQSAVTLGSAYFNAIGETLLNQRSDLTGVAFEQYSSGLATKIPNTNSPVFGQGFYGGYISTASFSIISAVDYSGTVPNTTRINLSASTQTPFYPGQTFEVVITGTTLYDGTWTATIIDDVSFYIVTGFGSTVTGTATFTTLQNIGWKPYDPALRTYDFGGQDIGILKDSFWTWYDRVGSTWVAHAVLGKAAEDGSLTSEMIWGFPKALPQGNNVYIEFQWTVADAEITEGSFSYISPVTTGGTVPNTAWTPAYTTPISVVDDPDSPFIITVFADPTGVVPATSYAAFKFRGGNVVFNTTSDIGKLSWFNASTPIQGPINISCPTASLTGQVFQEPGNIPIPIENVTVRATHQVHTSFVVEAQTDSNGDYELKNLIAGSYTMAITKTGYELADPTGDPNLLIRLQHSLDTPYTEGGRGIFLSNSSTNFQFAGDVASATTNYLSATSPHTALVDNPADVLTEEYLVRPSGSLSNVDYEMVRNGARVQIKVYYLLNDEAQTRIAIDNLLVFFAETGPTSDLSGCTGFPQPGWVQIDGVPLGPAEGEEREIVIRGGPGYEHRENITINNLISQTFDIFVNSEFSTHPNPDCL